MERFKKARIQLSSRSPLVYIQPMLGSCSLRSRSGSCSISVDAIDRINLEAKDFWFYIWSLLRLTLCDFWLANLGVVGELSRYAIAEG